jgi:16S rRNA (uracil1498-N3)-methyltransferase
VVPRFFAPAATSTGSLVELPDDEAAHLVRVLRLSTGATVGAFDGRGHEWRGIVEQATARRAVIRLVEPVAAAPEPRVRIVLASAILKGEKMDDVVRDAVMLGVAAIHPVVSMRVETRGRTSAGEARRARWQRIAVSSAKQCGRAVVPDVLAPSGLEGLLQGGDPKRRIALMEPGTGRAARRVAEVAPVDEVELVSGPEGGWTREEAARLAAASQLVTLGAQTLRADAVPIVAITALRVAWGDF